MNQIFQATYILLQFSFSKCQVLDEFDSNYHTQTGVNPKYEHETQRLFRQPKKKKVNH